MDTRGFNERDITESLDKITNAIKATGGELPPVTADDNGKILKVVNGDWNKGAAPTELPEVSGTDNGKILTVTEGEWAKGYAPTELPAVSSTDNGKILKVTEGVWAKGDAPGGIEKFVVTISGNSSDDYTMDKTLREIITADTSGKKVVFKFGPQFTQNANYVGWEFVLTGVKDTNGEYDIVSSYSTIAASDNMYSVGITIEGSSESDPYIWINIGQIG